MMIFNKYEEKVSTWFQTHSQAYQIGMGFAISISFILIGLIVRSIIAGTPDPESWAHYAAEGKSLTSYFTLAGALFGAVAGYVLMKSCIGQTDVEHLQIFTLEC